MTTTPTQLNNLKNLVRLCSSTNLTEGEIKLMDNLMDKRAFTTEEIITLFEINDSFKPSGQDWKHLFLEAIAEWIGTEMNQEQADLLMKMVGDDYDKTIYNMLLVINKYDTPVPEGFQTWMNKYLFVNL